MWQLRCSGAHCARTFADGVQRCSAIWTWQRGLTRHLAKRIGETRGEEDWRDTWRRGLARHGEDDPRGEEGGGGEGEGVLIKSSNPHLAGGEFEDGMEFV